MGGNDDIRLVIVDGLLQLACHKPVRYVVYIDDGVDLVRRCIYLSPRFRVDFQYVEITVQHHLVQDGTDEIDGIDDLYL